tara:strand:+ start:746 stop:889 length:144 start_codon:yes stop_codon:yes gene_type:complete
MKYYKYKYIDSKNKEYNISVYASSWRKAQEKFELENKDVKEIIKAWS